MIVNSLDSQSAATSLQVPGRNDTERSRCPPNGQGAAVYSAILVHRHWAREV